MKQNHTQFLGSCPHCSSEFRREKTAVVKQDEHAVTFHVDCAHCKNSLLLTVQSGAPGLITTVGVPTDLEKQDVIRFKKKAQPITTDDVLALHAFLEKDV